MKIFDETKSAKPFWKKGTFYWLIGFVVMVIVSQWPTIKGIYYRMAGPPEDGIGWRTDLAAALRESQETGKPVFVNFTAAWCLPCQVMKFEVWPDSRVSKLMNERVIPVRLDTETPEGEEAGIQYRVEALPTFLILDGEGQVIKQSVGALDADGMVAFLGE